MDENPELDTSIPQFNQAQTPTPDLSPKITITLTANTARAILSLLDQHTAQVNALIQTAQSVGHVAGQIRGQLQG